MSVNSGRNSILAVPFPGVKTGFQALKTSISGRLILLNRMDSVARPRSTPFANPVRPILRGKRASIRLQGAGFLDSASVFSSYHWKQWGRGGYRELRKRGVGRPGARPKRPMVPGA